MYQQQHPARQAELGAPSERPAFHVAGPRRDGDKKSPSANLGFGAKSGLFDQVGPGKLGVPGCNVQVLGKVPLLQGQSTIQAWYCKPRQLGAALAAATLKVLSVTAHASKLEPTDAM